MAIRGEWMWPTIALAVAGCASAGKLEIRPVGQSASVPGQPVSVRVALAQGHLSLGNVGLALEEYRRAVREEPGSIMALAGMARCYEQMGRFDLSRRYYEQALSIAPGEPTLALAFAASLDLEGKPEEARALRNEVAQRTANVSAPVTTASGSLAELPKQVTEARPIASAPLAPSAQLATTMTPAASLTVTLPPPRAAAAPRAPLRLERLSSGEVALVTSDRSPWAARKVAATPRSVTIRFEKREAMIVLNAARVSGIAARTRDYLEARGFAGAKIGDAPATRQQTLIRYPAAARMRAERIAAQFPFSARLEPTDGPLTLLVGRDAARRRTPRAG